MLDEAAAVLLDAAGLFGVLGLVLTAQLVRLAVAVQDDAAVTCMFHIQGCNRYQSTNQAAASPVI